jgi:cytochrome c oxidase cbb3-type subunit 1
MVVPLIAVAMNLYGTAGRAFVAPEGNAIQSFFVVATGAFIIAGLLRIITALTGLTDFTWFVPGTSHLLLFGFFGFIIFGAAYHIIPEVTGIELPCLKMARTHFWLVTAGLVVLVAPMILGGILQGVKLQDGNLAFPEIMKFTLGFLRITTLGDLLILAGSLVFLCNLGGLVVRLYKARATAAYMSATAEIQPAKLTP